MAGSREAETRARARQSGTGSRTTIENGRKRVLRGRRKARSDWAILLVDHHEGYLPWAEYERNQRLIADNANGKGMMVRGAAAFSGQ